MNDENELIPNETVLEEKNIESTPNTSPEILSPNADDNTLGDPINVSTDTINRVISNPTSDMLTEVIPSTPVVENLLPDDNASVVQNSNVQNQITSIPAVTPKKKSKIPIIILLIVLVLSLVGISTFLLFPKVKSIIHLLENKNLTENTETSDQKNYISINIPLSTKFETEHKHVKQTIYTLVYDENKTVNRIIFSQVYDTQENAKKEYESMKNGDTDNWGYYKTNINYKDKVVSYEYKQETLEVYFYEYINENIDSIIEEHGKDSIIEDFEPAIDITPNKNTSNKNKKSSNKVDYDSMAKQAESEIAASVERHYNGMYDVGYKYYAEIDKDSIQYTDQFSKKNDFYYVMEATVKNQSTNISIGKFYVRCKWNPDTSKIENYADNVRIILLLSDYSLGFGGFFVIKDDQYQNEALWSSETINLNNVNTVLKEINRIDYFYYQYSTSKYQAYFDSMKTQQIDYIHKLNCRSVHIYIAQVVTDNELATALELSKYLNTELYLGKKEDMDPVIDYFKNAGIFYEETIQLN